MADVVFHSYEKTHSSHFGSINIQYDQVEQKVGAATQHADLTEYRIHTKVCAKHKFEIQFN